MRSPRLLRGFISDWRGMTMARKLLKVGGKIMRVGGKIMRADPAVAPANQAPAAAFTTTVTDLTVQVNGSSSADPDGTVVAWAWSFGDGATATGQFVSHAYATAGTHTVTLTVTDDDGATATTTQQVTVTEPAEVPNAAPTAAFTSTASDLDVVFDATSSTDSDGTIDEHRWDFGDGGDATGVTASHAYATAGTYTVALTVTDNDGASATTTQQVTVAAPVNAVAAPVLLSIVESPERATLITRDAVPTGTVWDLYEASSADTGPVTTGLTTTTRQSGQHLFAGTTYTYWAVSRRLSDGAESTASNSLTITLASATTEPDPTPEPDPTLIARSTEDYPAGWESFTKIAWLPPGSQTPTPAGYTAVRDRRLFLDHTTDYHVICPEEFVDLALEINGGRNWVIQGLQGRMTTCHFGNFTPGKDTHTSDTDPGSSQNRFLRINGRNGYGVNTETVTRVLEGAYAKGQYYWEGIEHDCKDDRSAGLKLIIQNYRIDQVNFVESPNGKHFGGDVFQPYAGPGQLVIRGVRAPVCTYQGFFLQMDGGVMPDDQVVSVDISRVVLTGSRTWGHGYLWYDTVRGNTPAVDYTYGAKGTTEGVYIDPAPGEVSQTTHMDTLGRESVTISPSPHGDPVPAAHVGVNYPYTGAGATTQFVATADNTGLTDPALLTAYTGPTTVVGTTDPDAPLRIENKTISQQLTWGGGYVHLYNCDLNWSGSTGDAGLITAWGNYAERITAERCRLRPTTSNPRLNGALGHHFTLLRCDISNVTDAFGAYNTHGRRIDVHVRECYIHDLAFWTEAEWGSSVHPSDSKTHNDVGQVQSGEGLWFEDNTVHGYMVQGWDGQPAPAPDDLVYVGILCQQNVAVGGVYYMGDLHVNRNDWYGCGIPMQFVKRSSGGTNYDVDCKGNELRAMPRLWGGDYIPISVAAGVTLNGITYPAGFTADTNGNVWGTNPEVDAALQGLPVEVYGG